MAKNTLEISYKPGYATLSKAFEDTIIFISGYFARSKTIMKNIKANIQQARLYKDDAGLTTVISVFNSNKPAKTITLQVHYSITDKGVSKVQYVHYDNFINLKAISKDYVRITEYSFKSDE